MEIICDNFRNYFETTTHKNNTSNHGITLKLPESIQNMNWSNMVIINNNASNYISYHIIDNIFYLSKTKLLI